MASKEILVSPRVKLSELKIIYNNQIFMADYLLKLRGSLVLNCWQKVQSQSPFCHTEVAGLVKKLTGGIDNFSQTPVPENFNRKVHQSIVAQSPNIDLHPTLGQSIKSN